jgi:hypothetical protein
MTDLQLLLAIGIPSLLVVLSWISNNSRHDATNARIDRMEGRFDGLESRLNELLEAVHGDSLELMRAITALHERVAVVETKQNQ